MLKVLAVAVLGMFSTRVVPNVDAQVKAIGEYKSWSTANPCCTFNFIQAFAPLRRLQDATVYALVDPCITTSGKKKLLGSKSRTTNKVSNRGKRTQPTTNLSSIVGERVWPKHTKRTVL